MLVENRVRLHPLSAEHVETLRAIREAPEVREWWGALEDGFPLGDEPTATRYTIVVDGEVAGMVQYTEEPEPDYRHAGIDIFVGPRHLDQGIGTDALRALVRHLIEDRGHHRLTIDPAVDNARAVRCYEKVGFRPVGVMHRASRVPGTDRWTDDLLMELVVDSDAP